MSFRLFKSPQLKQGSPLQLKAIARKFLLPRPASTAQTTMSGPMSLEDIQSRLLIPVNHDTDDQVENSSYRDRGLFMARQDRWEELADDIRGHDQNHASTQTGMPIADLMIFGARSDAVRAAEHALLHGKPEKGAPLLQGVEALENILADHPDDYAIALIVAHMHIDIGWAWRGSDLSEDVPLHNFEAFEAHFQRASEILDEFCAYETCSPALLAARSALVPGTRNASNRLADEFETLIDIDTTNPRHMRALGNYLLPRWQGSFTQLDLEARRTAARTQSMWGAGAYTWVWFDALLVDPAGFGTLEISYFIEGVYDILDRRDDQHHANLMAAHLFRSWQIIRKLADHNTAHQPLAVALRHGFDHVVQNHLREIHPLLWGHAELGFTNGSRVVSVDRLAKMGQEIAIKAIALPFIKGLQAGETIRFDHNGITHLPS